MPPMVQKKNLMPESNSRSDDIHVPSWQAGKPAAFFLNMILSLQNSSLANVALKAGHALETAEERKNGTHENNCSERGILNVPLATEELGVSQRLSGRR